MKLYDKADQIGIPTNWWNENDHRAVVAAMVKTGAKRTLEFGPGGSTLSLIEGGATSVDTCEDSDDWAQVYEQRLARRFPTTEFPCAVRLHRFTWPEGKGLSIKSIKGLRFDLCLIDGPRGMHRRADVVRFALKRCEWVLMPLEELTSGVKMRPLVVEIAAKAGRPLQITETGPLSGAFALIGPKA